MTNTSKCAVSSPEAASRQTVQDLNHLANELRLDILDMVYKSKAGHIGGDFSVIEILTTLYFDVMHVSPDNWQDASRDRFLLSKGHCTDALYCVLARKGFFDRQQCINTFCTFGSPFIGHPNMEIDGIEMYSGSLGHGLPAAAGMAMAGKKQKKDYRVYTVLGDGEMAEGSNYEAMMAAGHYHLDNLCAVVDLNGLQISGETRNVMNSDSLAAKFKEFGWHVLEAENGNDCLQLSQAFAQAALHKGQPTVIIAHTTKGNGVSFMENQVSWHHGVLNDAQYAQAKEELRRKL